MNNIQKNKTALLKFLKIRPATRQEIQTHFGWSDWEFTQVIYGEINKTIYIVLNGHKNPCVYEACK